MRYHQVYSISLSTGLRLLTLYFPKGFSNKLLTLYMLKYILTLSLTFSEDQVIIYHIYVFHLSDSDLKSSNSNQNPLFGKRRFNYQRRLYGLISVLVCLYQYTHISLMHTIPSRSSTFISVKYESCIWMTHCMTHRIENGDRPGWAQMLFSILVSHPRFHIDQSECFILITQ